MSASSVIYRLQRICENRARNASPKETSARLDLFLFRFVLFGFNVLFFYFISYILLICFRHGVMKSIIRRSSRLLLGFSLSNRLFSFRHGRIGAKQSISVLESLQMLLMIGVDSKSN